MTRQVEVIEADREAAAPYVYGHTGLYSNGHLVLTGQLDDHEMVQAFARHRLQCTAGWQPIETAPKGDDPKESNGPPILIWREGWATGYEGFWCAYEQAWYFANLDSEYGSAEFPTHWMPLPSPPHSAGEGE